MRLRPLLALASVLLPLSVLPSSLPSAVAATPPPGAISKGVTFVANVPEMTTAISVNFIGDTMFVSAMTGIYAYSVKDPAAPTLLGALPMYIWENEDVDVDPARGLLFISRDPRGFTTQATPGVFPYGAIHVIDVSLPHAMTQISLTPIPAGHTTTCVNSCDYTWTGGPSNAVNGPADWKGRPIYGTDMRNPAMPVACPTPIDLGRNDGVTDYAHDVQVDPRGIAWVSGRGGVRGYWTSGKHKDPVDGKVKEATGCAPVPYAGGGTALGKTSGLMHNSWRNPSLKVDGRRGDVLAVTEENLASSCEQSGRFATYDLRNSYTGAGFKPSTIKSHRLRELDTWTPEEQEGATGCDSAHYFTDRGDGLVAIAFYGQGTRFLDVRNPKDIKQVGFFRPDDASTWAAYWRPGGYVYVADNTRGIDVLKIGALSNTAVTAPARDVPAPLNLPDATLGWMCAVPREVAAHHPSLV
jgi:hypothetical protein